MISGTHWPCVTLIVLPIRTDTFVYLFKKAILFYIIRNSEFSVISNQVSKVIALFG